MSEDEELLRARLAHWYDPHEIDLFFTLPHPQLGGKSVRSVIDAGHIEEVEAILDRLESGAYL